MCSDQAENPSFHGASDGDERPASAADANGESDASGTPAHTARARAGDALLGRSLALVRYLRAGCDWDAAQTSRSLRPYLLEEAHEVSDAILAGDLEALPGELGDLLLNLAFQIVVAEESGSFDTAEVVRRLETKMRLRHPHVYGDADRAPDWETMKAEERAAPPAPEAADAPEAAGEPGLSPESSVEKPFRSVPRALEPLSRAYRVQQKAAGEGFDWPEIRGAIAKLHEEIEELEMLLEREREADEDRPDPDEGPPFEVVPDADPGAPAATASDRLEEEVGDLLFAAVNVARMGRAQPSTALTRATRKFERRYIALLRMAAEREIEVRSASLEELDELWERVKAEAADEPS